MRQCVVSIPPHAEPVSLTEMKNHLRVESSVTDDDAIITSWITAARDLVETETGANTWKSHRVMVATTFSLTLKYFSGSFIRIPRVPLISVSGITYVDTAGTTQTLAASAYGVSVVDNCIYLAYGQSWPATRGADGDRITVTFLAGMLAPFTAATSDVVTVLGQTFTVGDRLRLLNSGGALPAGLSVGTNYYVIAGPSLSLTAGGAAVDITGTGTGTHYIGVETTGFATLQAAIKLTVGHWYEHREAVNAENMMPLPMAVAALVAAQHV